jgi:tetratricopeptide (TPR) repeat protein
MALNASGILVTPELLKPELYLPGRHGSLQAEMLAAARRQGALAYQLAPELKDLLQEVAANTPVIVLQNLGLSWYPVWHYAIVIGYDLDQSEIILRSGAEAHQRLSLRTFEYTWDRGGYWAMIALLPGKIPDTAKEPSYLASVSALERVLDPLRINRAYRAALSRWPNSLGAEMGLGNTAYQLNDLSQAEQAFRQAIALHPESAAAFNNLAQTLADQGQLEEALVAARQAVGLGGALHIVTLETLDSIERRLKK